MTTAQTQGTDKSGPAIIVEAGSAVAAQVAETPANTNPVYVYTTAEGGHFAPSKVDPHTRKDGKAPKTEPRPLKWSPLAANGETAVTYTRRTLSPETFAAYLAEDDAEKRAAILASVTPSMDGDAPRQYTSAVGLTVPQAIAARALVSREQLAAMNAAGIFARPTDRAEKAADTAGAKRNKTEAEKAADALDALDALFDAAMNAAAAPETPEGETPAA